jgi:hypothetical protein
MMMMEAVRTSETSVYFIETTRCFIQEECHLQDLNTSYTSSLVCDVHFPGLNTPVENIMLKTKQFASRIQDIHAIYHKQIRM